MMFSEATTKLQKDAMQLLEVKQSAARHRDGLIAEEARVKKELDEAHSAFNCAADAHANKCKEASDATMREMSNPAA